MDYIPFMCRNSFPKIQGIFKFLEEIVSVQKINCYKLKTRMSKHIPSNPQTTSCLFCRKKNPMKT